MSTVSRVASQQDGSVRMEKVGEALQIEEGK